MRRDHDDNVSNRVLPGYQGNAILDESRASLSGGSNDAVKGESHLPPAFNRLEGERHPLRDGGTTRASPPLKASAARSRACAASDSSSPLSGGRADATCHGLTGRILKETNEMPCQGHRARRGAHDQV